MSLRIPRRFRSVCGLQRPPPRRAAGAPTTPGAESRVPALGAEPAGSLNIAFIKGALVGYACGGALSLVGGEFFFRYSAWSVQIGTTAIEWFGPIPFAIKMLPLFGIVLGGYLGICWSR